MLCVLGRLRIVSVTVLVADASLPIMDNKLRLLVASDLTRMLDGLYLPVVMRGVVLVACPPDRPVLTASDNVLVLTPIAGGAFIRAHIVWCSFDIVPSR